MFCNFDQRGGVARGVSGENTQRCLWRPFSDYAAKRPPRIIAVIEVTFRVHWRSQHGDLVSSEGAPLDRGIGPSAASSEPTGDLSQWGRDVPSVADTDGIVFGGSRLTENF